MEIGNKFALLFLVAHFLYTADASIACAPRSFRYLEPLSSPSPSPSIGQEPTTSSDATPTTSPVPVQTPPVSQETDSPDADPAKTPPVSQETDSPDADPARTPPVSQETDSPDADPLPSTPTPKHESNPPSAAIPAQADPNVKKACDSTDNPLLCFTSVIPFLQDKFDPVSILAGEIKASLNFTRIVIADSLKIANDPSTTPDIAEALRYCQENFESVVSNLESAVNAMATRDVGTMNSMLSAVITDVSTCQDTFGETSTSPSPISDMEARLRGLASNCLAIVSFLKW